MLLRRTNIQFVCKWCAADSLLMSASDHVRCNESLWTTFPLSLLYQMGSQPLGNEAQRPLLMHQGASAASCHRLELFKTSGTMTRISHMPTPARESSMYSAPLKLVRCFLLTPHRTPVDINSTMLPNAAAMTTKSGTGSLLMANAGGLRDASAAAAYAEELRACCA